MSEVLVPYKYSKIAHFTSLVILKNAIRTYYYNEKSISILIFLCYIFTNLHWYKLKSTGFIRNMDICIVSTIFCYGYYRAFMYNCFGRYYICTSISIMGFAFNEYLNSLTLYKKNFHNMPESYKHQVYIRTTIVHALFLHIFQMENGGSVPEYCEIKN